MKAKLFLFALNEFNRELLENAANTWNLKNIKKILKFNYSQSITHDTYESDFLEPWVQWVSVQSGVESKLHGIKHLGDIPDLEVPQLWERLTENGVKCGIWGALNASLKKTQDAEFFVPDPWTFTQNAHPKKLQGFLDFPRYLAKNYLDFNFFTALKHLSSFSISLIKQPKALMDCFRHFPLLFKGILKHPSEIFVYFSFAEIILARVFFEERKKKKIDFSMFFANGIAHLQHYDWLDTPLKSNFRLQYGFECIDRILELAFQYKKEREDFIVMNALSQCNTNHEATWNSYKIQNPQELFSLIGIKYESIEPLMSYDGHILFSNLTDANLALRAFEEVKINGEKIFLVEKNPKDSLKIFYRSQFYAPLKENADFCIGNKSFKFFDYFKCLTTRTGKHIPTADVFTTLNSLPKRIMNHEIYSIVCNFFGVEPLKMLASKDTSKEEVATRHDWLQ